MRGNRQGDHREIAQQLAPTAEIFEELAPIAEALLVADVEVELGERLAHQLIGVEQEAVEIQHDEESPSLFLKWAVESDE